MLFMHCGWMRTGTTSLQAALVAHQAELAAAGIVYPDRWRISGRDNHDGIIELLEAADGDRNDWPAGSPFKGFQRALELLDGDSVLISSESLMYWLVDGRRQLFHDLLAAAPMPVRCVWTLRRVADVAMSLYLRHVLVGRDPAPPPDEVMKGLLADPNWPEDMFVGLLMLQGAAEETIYLRYDQDGSHNSHLLESAGVPPMLRNSIETSIDQHPRLNARLSHKGAVAILHREEITARAGVALDKQMLAELFYRGEFRFDEDGPCNLFDERTLEKMHARAQTAARNCGFEPYSEFYGDDELMLPPPLELDPDILSDEDLRRLAACIEGLEHE